MDQYRGSTVVITGASSGLGAEFARRFAERGADVVLVARRADRLQELAAGLEREYGVRAHPVPLDLGRPDAPDRLRDWLDRNGVRVDGLVNNAGFGTKGGFADSDPARELEQIALNVTALVALTRELLPELIASGRGVLVNLASTAAYQPCPQMAVYGATKAFVLSFTEALAAEARGSGLRVLSVAPGPTRTEFFDVLGDRSAAVGRFQTPAQVVSTTLRALDRRRTPASVVSGVANAVTARAAGLLPRRLVLAISDRALNS